MGRISVLRLATIVSVVCCFSILCGVSIASAQKKPAIRLGVNLDVTGYGAWLG